MGRTVAESLPLLRSQREDGTDQIEEETVDESQHVANDRCSERQLLPVFADDMDAVLKLLEKYANVPMSFADACLVRMTETLNDPMLLTTDGDFRIYRRHGRQTIPCVLPR